MFSVLVENGVDAKWGMTFMGSFILLAAILLRLGAGTWDEILHESGRSDLSEQERSEPTESTTPESAVEEAGNKEASCE